MICFYMIKSEVIHRNLNILDLRRIYKLNNEHKTSRKGEMVSGGKQNIMLWDEQYEQLGFGSFYFSLNQQET